MKLKSDCSTTSRSLTEKLTSLHETFRKQGLPYEELYRIALPSIIRPKSSRKILYIISFTVLLISHVYYMPSLLDFLLGIRCVLPNNYFIWEGTRPISDCSFCSNITEAIELHNVTRKEFEPYAYSSHPIVVRKAFLHWPALTKFSWQFFKELYHNIEDSCKSVDEECQFLHFKSDFISLKDVFSMSNERVNNLPGEKSWYVGWGNCHPIILEEMRKHYPKPHFLPEDAEIPHKEYVFMGYDDGATMHLDFINRLMWQAQLQGSKIWKLLPPPECQSVCQPLQFLVHPGDGVLVDTRIWYHGTTIPNGEFSLSIQSEYG